MIFTVFIIQLLILLTRKHNLNALKTGKYTIVELVKPQEPYSFMNTIFINPESYDPETYEQIIEHEKLHIDQAHFFDKLLAEFLVILFWFNPFVWMLRSSIGKNLEFLTDHTLLKKGMEKESYQMSLLKVSVSTKPFNLTTSYNNSFLKNRILMMNSKKSSIASIWKYMFILPLFFFSMISLNAVEQLDQSENITKHEDDISQKAELNEPERSDVYTPYIILPLSNPANTNYSKRELRLDKITAIQVIGNANVVISQSPTQKVIVEGPAELIDRLNLEVKDGKWDVKFNGDPSEVDKTQNISILLDVADLNSIAVSGKSDIAGKGEFKTEGKMNFAISGTSNIDMNVISSHTNCSISGTSNIALRGETDLFTVAISGSARIESINQKAKDATVSVSGDGIISLNAEETLVTSVSGQADISYSGNPKIKSNDSKKAKLSRIQ